MADLPDIKNIKNIEEYLNKNPDLTKANHANQNILHVLAKNASLPQKKRIFLLSQLIAKYPDLAIVKDNQSKTVWDYIESTKITDITKLAITKCKACQKSKDSNVPFSEVMVSDLLAIQTKLTRFEDANFPVVLKDEKQMSRDDLLGALLIKKASERNAKGKYFNPITVPHANIKDVLDWVDAEAKKSATSLRIPIILADPAHRNAVEIIVEDNKKYFIFFDSRGKSSHSSEFDTSVLNSRGYTYIEAPTRWQQSDSINCTLFSLNYLADAENMPVKKLLEAVQSENKESKSSPDYHFFKNAQSISKQKKISATMSGDVVVSNNKQMVLGDYLQHDYHLNLDADDLFKVQNTKIYRKRVEYLNEIQQSYVACPYTLEQMNHDRADFSPQALEKHLKKEHSKVLLNFPEAKKTDYVPKQGSEVIFYSESYSKMDDETAKVEMPKRYMIDKMYALTSIMHAHQEANGKKDFADFFKNIPDQLASYKKVVENELFPFLKETLEDKTLGFEMLINNFSSIKDLDNFVGLNRQGFSFLLHQDQNFIRIFSEFVEKSISAKQIAEFPEIKAILDSEKIQLKESKVDTFKKS